MANGFPSTIKVEIEFAAGTWTDVTADVQWSAGVTMHYGRLDQFQTVSPATLNLVLYNTTGKYTPGSEVLADGVTAHPYYPNVVPRKRIRVSFVVSATTYYRYYGYIAGWPPEVENGIRPLVPIVAYCRLKQLDQKKLRSWFVEEADLQVPAILAYYSMSDMQPDTGSVAAFGDTLGGQLPLVQTIYGAPQVGAIQAGANSPLPQSDGLTGASFQAQANMDNGWLFARLAMDQANLAVGFWVTFPTSVTSATSELTLSLIGPGGYIQIDVADTGTGPSVSAGIAPTSGLITSTTGLTGITVGVPHYVQLNLKYNGSTTYTGTLTVDGVSAGTCSTTVTFPLQQVSIRFNQTDSPATSGPIVLGSVILFDDPAITSSVPSSSTLYSAGCGWSGQLTGTRVQKLLTYAGLTSSDWTLSPGAETMSGQQSIIGRSVLDCCQDVVTTEGGGSVIYTQPSSKIRWVDRHQRQNPVFGTANVFVGANNDIRGSAYSPAYDDETLVNLSTVARPGGFTQTYIDAASKAAYGETDDQATSYASSDVGALNLAQWRVASRSKPQFRVGQLTVSLLTATTNIYSQVGGSEIGSQVELGSLVPGKSSPKSKVQIFVEGWTETIRRSASDSVYDWVADTSPWPYWHATWDDANFGRWSGDAGTQFLFTGGITAAATTLAISTGGGSPTFTTTSGSYPFIIQIGEEAIQLNSPPGGATSPQTFTGVTRGALSTIAVAHAFGVGVTLARTPAWAL